MLDSLGSSLFFTNAWETLRLYSAAVQRNLIQLTLKTIATTLSLPLSNDADSMTLPPAQLSPRDQLPLTDQLLKVFHKPRREHLYI